MWLYITVNILGFLGFGIFNLIMWAFITDIIDDRQVRMGKREDGTVYAVYSFARKLGQALAGGLGGFALTAIGYVSDAAAQSRQVAGRIYTVATLVPGICYLLVFLVLQFWYPLSREKVEENTRILREKRE
jgi:GPH family glycoside/pentoside/hexuronide:cation symporter